MNYGLYLSASGALTATYRQDVQANNLANVNTVGFKPEMAVAQARFAESLEGRHRMEVGRKMLDRLGGGVLSGPQRTNQSVGAATPTGNPLDAALLDANAFFSVHSTDPDTGQRTTALTRDGRFMVGPDGRLVHQDGHPALDPAGNPILLEPGVPARIAANGDVVQRDVPVARLGVVAVPAPDDLLLAGGNLLTPPPGVTPTALDAPRIATEATEASGADPITALMGMMAATKAATGNLRMIQYHDQTMNSAINTFGRVG